MTTRCYILLGGLFGWDGPVTSNGMYGLAHQLQTLDGPVTTYNWSNYLTALADIQSAPATDKTVLIGYSGGGSRATWLAATGRPRIDLMVCYDPSPSWQMKPLGNNVLKAICYHNTAPMMLGLGGGVLVGPQVTTIDIAEQHLAVQYDQSLHAHTILAITLLGAST